jgi:acetyl esterase/lipase
VKGVWVEPVPELVLGDLKTWAEISNVEPIRIPGYWIDQKGCDIEPGSEAAPGEKVFYHFHGGAYILLSAHPSQPTAAIMHGLMQHSPIVKRSVQLL